MSKVLVNPDAVVAIEYTDCGRKPCIEVLTVVGKRYYADAIEVVEEFGQKWIQIRENHPKI